MARASAFQAEGRGFESRFPLHHRVPPKTPEHESETGTRAHVAQQAEHLLGKEEVTSSNLVMGSISEARKQGVIGSDAAREDDDGEGKVRA